MPMDSKNIRGYFSLNNQNVRLFKGIGTCLLKADKVLHYTKMCHTAMCHNANRATTGGLPLQCYCPTRGKNISFVMMKIIRPI